MIGNIKDYLSHLKKVLSGSDRAIIQDALADAEEYLHNTLKRMQEENPDITEADAIAKIIEVYGAPDEVAAAYKRIELSTSPYSETSAGTQSNTEIEANILDRNIKSEVSRKWYLRFFGIIADPLAWGALLYLLLLLPLGIIYFTWAVTGLSLSSGLFVLIIGLPLVWLFLLSVRGMALLEGRIVEALTGIRMPRRQLFANRNLNFWGRLKSIVMDKYTWFSLIYFIICLPLGIFYFSLLISLVAVSLYLIATPVLELIFHFPLFINYDMSYYLSVWLMPVAVIVGIALLFGVMHLSKVLGQLQGKLAKVMLVRPYK